MSGVGHLCTCPWAICVQRNVDGDPLPIFWMLPPLLSVEHRKGRKEENDLFNFTHSGTGRGPARSDESVLLPACWRFTLALLLLIYSQILETLLNQIGLVGAAVTIYQTGA